MNIHIVGFGKMGKNIALNYSDKGYDICAFDVNVIDPFTYDGSGRIDVYQDEQLFYEQIEQGDLVYVFVPHGDVTELTLAKLLQCLPSKTYIVEGGNSNYQQSKIWFEKFSQQDKFFFDLGTSGGVEGARYGMNAMIGGDAEAFTQIEALLKPVCSEKGLLYTGPSGSGHYLKMVHNGIEYGMMQAIAECFEFLEYSEYNYDYQKVAALWNDSSVIRSWLMELLIDVFDESPKLDNWDHQMHASGQIQWLIEEAMQRKVPLPVTTISLMVRDRSLQQETFSGKVVSALRGKFGGHATERKY